MILIVEDELLSRKSLASLLHASGYDIEAVESAEQALHVLEGGHVPDLALIDYDLPGMNGLDLIKYLAEHNPSVHSVMVTAAGPDRVERLRRDTRMLLVRKPIDFCQLLSLIHEKQLAHLM